MIAEGIKRLERKIKLKGSVKDMTEFCLPFDVVEADIVSIRMEVVLKLMILVLAKFESYEMNQASNC